MPTKRHDATSGADMLPYLDDYWRDQIVNRHIHKTAFHLQSYPPNSPLSCRPDWKPKSGVPGSDLDLLRAHALDGFRHPLRHLQHAAWRHRAVQRGHVGGAMLGGQRLGRARNGSTASRACAPRSSLPLHNPDLAVKEIERLAPDRRFVQVLVPVMGEAPLGRRIYWPIYQAAEKHGLPIGVHAGSTYRHAPTSAGWPTYQVEDYIIQGGSFENQLLSLIAEGVFQQFPKLKLVCIESGFTWLPTLLWRINKTWRGVRAEVPWLDRPPADILKDHVRFTLQPLDAPPGDPQKLIRTLEHIGTDHLLLFSTDYPHWQFDGNNVLPEGLPDAMMRKMLVDNPLDTYPRLREETPAGAKPSRTEETVP